MISIYQFFPVVRVTVIATVLKILTVDSESFPDTVVETVIACRFQPLSPTHRGSAETTKAVSIQLSVTETL